MAAVTLAGALRNANGVRLCPLGCGPNAPIPTGAKFADNTCQATKRRSGGRPGETEFVLPLPGKCRMFYNERGEPT